MMEFDRAWGWREGVVRRERKASLNDFFRFDFLLEASAISLLFSIVSDLLLVLF